VISSLLAFVAKGSHAKEVRSAPQTTRVISCFI
jgi:hypothetical protein